MWKFSRFPTYFADAMFWFGLYFINLGVRINDWWMIVYPLTYFVMLYCGMSLSEAELIERKENYEKYCEKVNRFMFWPQKVKIAEEIPFVQTS